jgi:hypothetical protein
MFKLSVQFLIAGLLTLTGVAFGAGPVKLASTSQAACFDENGAPRPCAGTGEDGEKQTGVAWPPLRFSDNNNGTVTDNLTGLTWSKHANAPSRALANDPPYPACLSSSDKDVVLNPETSMTWLQALDFITCLNAASHAGITDWRLPNLNELESLVNPGVADTSAYLNANGFGLPGQPNSKVQQDRYWSSTSDASSPVDPQTSISLSAISAWNVDLATGDFPDSTLKNDLEFLPRRVWPVSGKTSTQAQLWQTGQALCFDEVGAARPCAGTGEDGEKLAGALWPTPRFKPNSDGTVAVDRLTQLTWTTATQTPGPDTCADTGFPVTWQQALDHVACLNSSNFLGHSDWRLPNRKELHSLSDYSTGAPALPVGHPFDDLAGNKYWSSTTDLSSPTDAWTVSMFDGSLSSAIKAKGYLPAWPVRGPDLTPPATTVTPNPGTYNVSVTVSLASSENESTIYYTTDGTPVSTSSSVYSAPFTLTAGDTTATSTVQYFSVDSAGNVEAAKSAVYTLRVNDLAGSMKINAGASLTNVSAVTLTLAARASAGVSSMQFSNDGVNFTAPESFATTKSWVLSPGNGLKSVHVKFTDGRGVVYAPVSSSIIVDSTALAGTVAINNGAVFTNTRLVNLALSARSPAGVTDMQVACDGTNFASAEPYASARNCTLSSEDGLKTVSVKFKDGLGAWSNPINAQITLDTIAPTTTSTPAPGTFGGKATVTLTANESAIIYFTTDGTVPTTSSPVYAVPFGLVPSVSTEFKVQYFAVDPAGNSEQVKNAVFKVNVSDLTGSISINNGDTFSASPAVALTLSAKDSTGVTRMQFSNDGNTYSPLEPYATGKAWTLSDGDGNKTVYVRFESGTGALYTFSASTMLLTTAASVSNGDLNGDKKIDIADALKALQITIGLYSPTLEEMIRGDVAPLENGKPKQDGKIDLADAMVILRRSLGLVSW